jgi:hypothetical protein
MEGDKAYDGSELAKGATFFVELPIVTEVEISRSGEDVL